MIVAAKNLKKRRDMNQARWFLTGLKIRLKNNINILGLL